MGFGPELSRSRCPVSGAHEALHMVYVSVRQPCIDQPSAPCSGELSSTSDTRAYGRSIQAGFASPGMVEVEVNSVVRLRSLDNSDCGPLSH